MKHSYNSNSLISFLYGDCSLFSKLEIEHWIAENNTVEVECDALRNAVRSLPKVKFAPAHSTIENILNFSKQKGISVC